MSTPFHRHTAKQLSRRPATEPERTPRSTPDALFVDNRLEVIAKQQLADVISNSPQLVTQQKVTETIHNSPYMVTQCKQFRGIFGTAAQLRAGPEEEGPLQDQFATVQREDEETSLQGKCCPAQPKHDPVPQSNHTGLPDKLKSGNEALSGSSRDNVKVHYNSSRPVQLNALAYAHGTDIHVAPGQEQHLPHEVWHVSQQAQERVQPTMQMSDVVPVNEHKGLENEADVMREKAIQLRDGKHDSRSAPVFPSPLQHKEKNNQPTALSLQTHKKSSGNFLDSDSPLVKKHENVKNSIIQRKVGFEFEDGSWNSWIKTGSVAILVEWE